jgi:hypothetical protein
MVLRVHVCVLRPPSPSSDTDSYRKLSYIIIRRRFIHRLKPVVFSPKNSIKRPRCGRCGHVVSFRSAGKYGKMQKKLVVMLRQARCRLGVVQ